MRKIDTFPVVTRRPIRLAASALALLGMVAALVAMPVVADPALLVTADTSRVTPKMLKKCAKCHGDDGISEDPEAPHLAGQRPSYLLDQLIAFKNDARDGGRMNKTAKKYDDQQLADMASYFAAKPLPEEDGVSALAAPGLVDTGDAGRGIDACADCHGADGRGKKDKYEAPALAGMPLLYFATSMQAFRDGDRANDADGVMRKAAKTLADDEIKTLASYYLALGKRKPLPPL